MLGVWRWSRWRQRLVLLVLTVVHGLVKLGLLAVKAALLVMARRAAHRL